MRHTPTHLRDDDDDGGACEEYIPLLVRAADGGLDPGQRAQLDVHTATCPACREALDVQNAAHLSLVGAFDVESAFGFSTRVFAHLQPEAHWLDRFDFRRWTWRVSPVAAALGVAAYLLVATTQSTAASEMATASDTEAVATAVSEPAVVDTADLVAMEWQTVVEGVDDGVTGERAQ